MRSGPSSGKLAETLTTRFPAERPVAWQSSDGPSADGSSSPRYPAVTTPLGSQPSAASYDESADERSGCSATGLVLSGGAACAIDTARRGTAHCVERQTATSAKRAARLVAKRHEPFGTVIIFSPPPVSGRRTLQANNHGSTLPVGKTTPGSSTRFIGRIGTASRTQITGTFRHHRRPIPCLATGLEPWGVVVDFAGARPVGGGIGVLPGGIMLPSFVLELHVLSAVRTVLSQQLNSFQKACVPRPLRFRNRTAS